MAPLTASRSPHPSLSRKLGSWLSRWRVPGAAWLATISYSLYLVHKPVYHLVAQLAGSDFRGYAAFAAYALAALAGGTVLHVLVERPCLVLRGRLLAPSPRRPAVAAT